jgi:hypothetical protein
MGKVVQAGRWPTDYARTVREAADRAGLPRLSAHTER